MTGPPLNIERAIEDEVDSAIKAMKEEIENLESRLDVLYIKLVKLQRIRRNNGFKPLPKQDESSASRKSGGESIDSNGES